jgi:ABC-type transport system involved in multi-copper enzyme maturation permease subunit
MKRFWALFRKEDKFLAGPGIAMLVLITVNVLVDTVSTYYSASYIDIWIHYGNTGELFKNLSVVKKLIISPLAYSFSYAKEYFYALIFLYAVLHERITRSTYQSFMLPGQRWKCLAAKYGAVVAWYLPIVPLLMILGLFLKIFLAGRTGTPLSIARGTVEDMYVILAVCGLAMLSYVVAMTVRRWRYLAGAAVFLAGYYFMGRMSMHIEQFILRNRAVERGLYTVFHGFLDRDSAPDLIMAMVFCVVSFVLYERTSEV